MKILGHQQNRRVRGLLSILNVICLVFACAMSVYLDASDSNAKALYDERKDYEDEKNSAEAYQNTVELLVEQIKEVNDQIAEQTELIESASKSIADVDLEIEQMEQDIADVEDDMAERRQQLSDILSVMYESSLYDNQISFVMKADDMFDIIDREEYVSGVTSYIDERVASLEEVEEDKLDKMDDLVHLRDERQDLLEDYEEEQQALSDLVEELGDIMEEAEQQAEDSEALADALRSKVVELEAQERSLLEGKSYNGESSNVVYDGDGTDYYYTDAYPYTDEEVEMLAAIIQCEAGSVSYPGMIAVGSVVMNRVESASFPNTIAGVIYAPYQFEPVSTGSFAVTLAQGAASSCYTAALDVLEGKRNVPNFYFKAAWYADEHGISGVNIGGNVFH